MQEISGLLILLAIALIGLLALLTTIVVWHARRPPRHTAGYAIARGLAVDPGDRGLAYDGSTLDLPGGVMLPVWEIEVAPAGVVPVRPVTGVFVHGWGQSRIDMLARIDAWRADLDRVVLYDLRGHGDAEGGLSRLGHGEERDLLELLARLGSGPRLLIGHSMGARIALAAAADAAPDLGVAGVIAHGSFVDMRASMRRRIQTFNTPARPMSDLAMAWLRLRGMRMRDPLADAAALRCPLLVIHGEHDEVAGTDEARRLAAAAADGTFVEVAGGGHLDAHDVSPETFEAAVAAFVARLS